MLPLSAPAPWRRLAFLRTALFVATAATLLSGGLVGCGWGTTASGCTVGTLSSSTAGNPNFTLAPSASSLTIYPGQTEQFNVTVQPVNGSSGVVTVGGANLPYGVSISSATTTIGSTVPLTITATNDVVTQCFTGAQGLFTAGVPLSLQASTGSASATTQVGLNVVLENPAYSPASVTLPVLTITTTGDVPVTSKDTYLNANMTITGASKKSYNFSGTTEIKGHGNSTWIEPKKPYRLNLPSKASLLGMASDSNWILLANYDDKTMLRNTTAFQMSNIVGMAWTPSSAFVELYLNGQYEGVYQLTEKVEVSKARLNIGSIDDTDNSGDDLTGGYLAEIDSYLGETYMVYDRSNIPVGIYDPSTPTQQQEQYFLQNFGLADTAIYSSDFSNPADDWQAYWDAPSAVNYFIVEELAGNQDEDDWSSDYFYKPRLDPHWYRGPVWDMDITFGNDNYGAIVSPNVPWVSTNEVWYSHMIQDPYFLSLVKARWAQVRPQMLTLPAFIDTQAAAMTTSQANNYARWKTLGEKVWPNPQAAGSYQGEIDSMKSWLTQRIAYMDAHYTP